MRGIGRRYVSILRSESEPSHHYVGVTGDVDERLEWHNGGPSGHTVNYRPWRVIVSIEFPDEQSAVRFERYLNPDRAEPSPAGILAKLTRASSENKIGGRNGLNSHSVLSATVGSMLRARRVGTTQASRHTPNISAA